MKRKAIMLPETLKIIIAIVCIVLLIYLAWSLYDLFIVKSDLAKARETLKQINNEISLLDELDERNYLVVSPEKWYFVSYEDKLCICSGDDVAKREECCINGAKADNDGVIIDSMCVTPTLKEENCISFADLPMNIQLIKEGEIKYARTEASSTATDTFNKLLEFKGSGDKTVLELCQAYVNNLKNLALAEQIDDLVKEAPLGEDIQFQILEGETIRLNVRSNSEGKEPGANYWLYQTALDRKKEITNPEGRIFVIVLKVGEYKFESDGYSGMKV